MATKQELDTALKIQRDAYNDTINHLMANFTSQLNIFKVDFDNIKSELNAAKLEIFQKQTQIESLSSKIEELETVVEGCRFDPVPVFSRLNSLEDYSRKNNLRIDGVPESHKENWENIALQVKKLSEKLGCEREVKLDRAQRIGSPGSSERPRTVLVRFHNYTDRQFFLRNSHKLKGTKVFVNEDLCQPSLNIRKEKLPLLLQARREGKTAYFNHINLVIKDKILNSPPEQDQSHQTKKKLPSSLNSSSLRNC